MCVEGSPFQQGILTGFTGQTRRLHSIRRATSSQHRPYLVQYVFSRPTCHPSDVWTLASTVFSGPCGTWGTVADLCPCPVKHLLSSQ